jgi:SAM-dependent methyltransferase/uncharacterized protein YbaR (Trm112 family)
MRDWLLSILACPVCGHDLKCAAEKREGDDVLEGALSCTGCAARFPITNGVPRLLAMQRASIDPLAEVKEATQSSFGFEWQHWARHGWEGPEINLATEEPLFLLKARLEPSQFAGKLVLDAGCGNGRYSYFASNFGGRVVGVDLSAAVDVARENLRSHANVSIVQADLFHLPFKKHVFDIVFSIGVLMHTGDARVALGSIREHLAPGGSLTAHFYGEGNKIYEWMDRTIRGRTTKLSPRQLMDFTNRLHAVAKMLDAIKIRPLVTAFVRLDEHPHCIYDWYSAPVASHHTYPQVEGWFRELGLQVVATNRSHFSRHAWKTAIMKAVHFPMPVTVRGTSPAA